MSCAHPNDIEPARSYLESYKAMVANTTKPMVMTSEHAGDLAVMCAVAEALRGGPEELAAKPYFTMYLEPVSPLSHPVESVDKLLFCADHGIPAIYSPAPLAGGTAPITVAGTPARAWPSRSSAWSSTSCASRARRSCSASARPCSTWRPRRAPTTRPSTS